MKILALSLLRIGDFFQHVQFLNEVAARNPEAHLHVVAFADIKSIQNLFPKWSFHFIPRLEIQRDFVEKDRPWYRGLYLLESALAEVFATEWSLVLNPTQTGFSARLMDCLQAQEKRGTQFLNGQTAGWNQDLHFLNDYYQALPKPELSWIELTSRSLGFELPHAKFARVRTHGEIWLNPTTSDARKDWPLANWKNLASSLKSQDLPVRVLGAPGDQQWLETEFQGFEIGAWKFQDVKNYGKNCRLLISGDTSTPHLLALQQVPMLTLFLGPANDFKTAPRLYNSSILATRAHCAPCGHRGACTQERQICSDTISVLDVLQVTEFHLQERARAEVNLSALAEWRILGELHESKNDTRQTASRTAHSSMAGTA